MENSQNISPRLQLLNEFSTRLQSLIDSDRFHQDVLDIIQKKFQYYAVQIWLIENGKIVLKASDGAYNEHLKIGDTMPLHSGITGHVVKTKKSYLSNDISKDPNFTNLSLPTILSKAELCVPILNHQTQNVIGTLNIESDKADSFDEWDIVTLEAIASQVAVSISNQKLYKKTKDFNVELQLAVDDKTIELRKAHEKILEQQKLLQKENKALRNLVSTKDGVSSEVIGESPTIKNLLSMVDKIAPTTATVLILGESGTGKELIARRLHYKSERSDRPYVVVNCGALQETLLESELFGHEKGSFTGAHAQKMGLVETADGGTLFLDEIGELSPNIQAKLLRFLQDGEFYRIGGKKTLKVDVRVISATNRDLEQEVKTGKFREDLFYRLNTIALRVPPLRKRSEDITLLFNYFIQNSKFTGSAPQIKKIDPRVMEIFKNYEWPGNIRELQNTVERLTILAEDQEIKLEDVPFNIRMPKNKLDTPDYQLSLPLEEVEKNHILKVLAYHHGNKTKAAQSLGVTIKTLYNKLHRYGSSENNNLEKFNNIDQKGV